MTEREKLYDLKNQRKTLIDECKAMALEGKHQSDEYKEKSAKVKGLTEQIEAVEAMVAQEEKIGGEAGELEKHMKGMAAAGEKEQQRANVIKSFADAARKGFRVEKATGDMMSEGVDADGGYTVPKDIVNDIIRLRETKESLLEEVTVIPVNTKSGSRTVKTRSQHMGFFTVAEAAKMGKLATPKFTTIAYEIKKRRGYMPITNELLEDSDAAIASVATEWLSDEACATANREILEVVAQNTPVDLVNLDGILRAWVGLGSAFRSSSKLITNDDGLFWLGTLKDTTGRQLLTPNPGDPHKLQLCIGPHTVPVKSCDNGTVATVEGKVPMILGDLKEGVIYWDRRAFSIKLNDSGVVGDLNALEDDLTLWVGSMRDDCTARDKDAFVNGYITLPEGFVSPTAAKAVRAAKA